MKREWIERTTRCGILALIIIVVCLAGCRANGRPGSGSPSADGARAKDLRIEGAVQTRATDHLDTRMVRIYWAGERSYGIDDGVHLSSGRAVLRYLSNQPRERLDHGILLVTTRPGPGFDPLDTLSRWCLKHDVALYCVALNSGEPAEPAVPDDTATRDWRDELPRAVHCVVWADSSRCAEPGKTPGAGHDVLAGPVAAR